MPPERLYDERTLGTLFNVSFLNRLFPPATPDNFARRLLGRLGGRLAEKDVRFDAARFQLQIGETGFVNLGNVYAMYASAPIWKRQAALDQAIDLIKRTGLDPGPLSLEKVADHVLPRVWSDAYPVLVQLDSDEHGSTGIKMVTRSVCPGLIWGLVIDEPSSVAILGGQQYEELGTSLDSLWPIARDNLYKMSVGRFEQVAPGVFASPFHDNHDAARLLLPDLFNDLNLAGNPVAVAARPEWLFVCGRDNARAIGDLAGAAREASQQPGRSVSPLVVEYDGHAWSELKLERSHPAWSNVELNRRLARAGDYSEQAGLLQRHEDKAGRDCSVPAPHLVLEPTGEPYTWVVWSEQITDALIPEVDIVFVGEPPRAARWVDVRRVWGDRMRAEHDDPLPRWRVGRGPSNEEIARVETAAPDDVVQLLRNAPDS